MRLPHGVKLDPPKNTGLKELMFMQPGQVLEITDQVLIKLGCTKSALTTRVKKSSSFEMGTRTADKARVIVRVR